MILCTVSGVSRHPKKYNKVLDIEEGQAASEDEDEMDSEIEYVEAYEELGTKDDKEDFGGLEIARSQMDNDNGNAVTR
nr:hypothetical protein CFP56_41723 [Quercus suber]